MVCTASLLFSPRFLTLHKSSSTTYTNTFKRAKKMAAKAEKMKFFSFKPPLINEPVFQKTRDIFQIGFRVEKKESRSAIFLRINKLDAAPAKELLEHVNNLFVSYTPKTEHVSSYISNNIFYLYHYLCVLFDL